MKHLLIRILSLLTALLSFSPVYTSEREYAVKAGFIYNFARYSDGDWFDPELSAKYIVCSFNPEFVLSASKTLVNQKVKNRPVEVHLVSRMGIPDESCNSFFLTERNYNLLANVVANERLNKAMLISEKHGFIEDGGHINLFIAGGKVRFEVDAVRLQSAGINMSSKVLRLGRVIEEQE